MRGSYWTNREEKILRDMAGGRASTLEIAAKLGRSRAAVHHHAVQLGISLKAKPKSDGIWVRPHPAALLRIRLRAEQRGMSPSVLAQKYLDDAVLGVGQQTISNDLATLPTAGNAKPAKTASNPPSLVLAFAPRLMGRAA